MDRSLPSYRLSTIGSSATLFKNFISMANNAIHSSTYHFIEQAFKYYKLWEEIVRSDQKKTFHTKHRAFRENKDISTSTEGYLVLKRLFPK
jgi:hypothetical protein